MDLHDQVPVLVLHVLETDIPEDTGIVDEYIDPAESLDGRFDDSLTIFNAIVIRHCLSAGSFDLIHDNISSLSSYG